MRTALLALILIAGCKGKNGGSDATASTCGNGEPDPGEVCDDGPANSNDTPNACRLNCTLPVCGDGVTDQGEDCDDANGFGGDGCLPDCTTEAGPFETEPNNDHHTSEAMPAGGEVAGSLPDEDRDCFRVAVPENGYLEAELLPDADGVCADYASLEVLDADGSSRGAVFPEFDKYKGGNGCPALTPDTDVARYLDAGDYHICVEGLFNAPVTSYRLALTVGEDSCTLPVVPGGGEDMDGDGIADNCDDDMDGDGIDNDADNCVSLSNGPLTPVPMPNADGYIGTWLVLAPFENRYSPYDCVPSYDELVTVDANNLPVLGQMDAGLTWTAAFDPSDRMDFDDWYWWADDPREIYLLTHVHSDQDQTLTFAIGTDDGARVWFNHQMIHEDTGCHSANRDDFEYEVQLQRGWNPLLIRIYDGGGGWRLYARFKNEYGDPVTDLELSLTPGQSQVFDQTDSDGDGVGDLCEGNPVP